MKSSVLNLIPFLAVASAASSGCKTTLPSNLTPGASTHNLTLSSKSVIGKITQREYILHIPANYKTSNDVSTPLIVAFHGQQQPAWSMEKISELSNPAFNNNTIVAYPEGMNVQAPGVQWLGDPLAPNSTTIDDRILVGELLNHLNAMLCIDTSRVYAAGLSNGGGLTGLAMCDAALNKRFAAFATVAGAFYPDASLTEPLFEGDCQPALNGRSLPYINLHGLADTVVAYNGTNTPPPASIRVPEWVAGWATRSACDPRPSSAVVESGTVTQYGWTCGGKQDTVVHRAISAFGHGWPSIKNQGEPFETLRGGPTSWDATPLILEWFGKWTL
ncbi:carbohydrate esterase family 1 protein [Didymella exigua CBS 183.55]|uniref:feruloyl esterase n=1 Tax=Didymella exigua CBS 183.55 TaxID=1150837 RepID=A0A6A5S403_9PLEO|nr:carbohydrate esterase family 1 protein [Didymella exigua CBS 183.55]KAF1933196.1 carbohydrate esterase family 1 protein [Didymella exigua CBS 183.55]